MRHHRVLSLTVAGLVAGMVAAGCASKQVREEGAVSPPGGVPPAKAESSPDRGAESAKVAAPARDARAEAQTPAAALPARSGALEPAARTSVSDSGLPGATGEGLHRIHFEFDQAALSPEARGILRGNAAYLSRKSDVMIRVEGHCDERGTAEYNLALGEKRAKSAYQYLIDLGTDPKRIKVVTYGEETPLDPRHNEEAWAQNRRAEFVERRK
jgi:peptidoglycan-associated lipoprotein